jgi:hypothetical protein
VTPGNLTFKQAKARMLSTILAAGTNAWASIKSSQSNSIV